ncbi:MAG: hypothetical protein ACFFA3_02510 [Promethearchaeota archaeon]
MERIYQEIINESYERSHQNKPKNDINYSELVIPFSQICKSDKSRDIYAGNEKIPFKERDYEFRMILKHEFSKLLKI